MMGRTANPRIALVVGNGLTIDYCNFAGLLGRWNPSDPFSWSFKVQTSKGKITWQQAFPWLAQEFASRGQVHSFAAFEAWMANPGRDFTKLYCEATHFLVQAYALFSQQAAAHSMRGWAWLDWLQQNADSFIGVTSFNYDRVVEDALIRAGVNLRFPWELPPGVFIHKPHGSCDFEADPSTMGGLADYPLRAIGLDNDFPIIRVPPSRLLLPRGLSTVVLPAHLTRCRDYQWVGPGYQRWHREASTFTHLVLIGISYWDCDRPEILELLDSVNPHATVIVANPNPPRELMLEIALRKLRYVEWRAGPGQLPAI